MGRQTKQGESPVYEMLETQVRNPEYGEARGTLSEAAGTIPQG